MTEQNNETTDTTTTEPKVDPVLDTTDWKVEARKWEQRAKDNKDAADRLTQLEDAQKSELERAQEAAELAQRELADVKAEATRFRIAAKYGISEEDQEVFLTASDEEGLERQASKLSEKITAKQTNDPEKAPRAGFSLETGNDDSSGEENRNDIARNLFGI